MAKESIKEIAFIKSKGIFCYIVMALELKNARATNQWMVNRLFSELLDTTMEAYTDDMLAKSTGWDS